MLLWGKSSFKMCIIILLEYRDYHCLRSMYASPTVNNFLLLLLKLFLGHRSGARSVTSTSANRRWSSDRCVDLTTPGKRPVTSRVCEFHFGLRDIRKISFSKLRSLQTQFHLSLKEWLGEHGCVITALNIDYSSSDVACKRLGCWGFVLMLKSVVLLILHS